MIRLDDRDLKILEVLQSEGRISKIDLAARVNLSATACWERLKRLEDTGVIEGYGAKLSLVGLGPTVTVFMQAEISSHRTEDFERFEQAVKNIPEIVECWAVGGGVDYFLKFVSTDIDTYQRVVDRMLEDDVGLKRYYTYIVTKPIKNEQVSPLSSFSPTSNSE